MCQKVWIIKRTDIHGKLMPDRIDSQKAKLSPEINGVSGKTGEAYRNCFKWYELHKSLLLKMSNQKKT